MALPSLLDTVSERDVIGEPFPHIVVDNALPEEVVRHLIADWPDDRVIRNGARPGSNRRFTYSARQTLEKGRVAESWRSFVLEHASSRFFQQMARIFAPWIAVEYPALVDRFGPGLEGMRAAVRGIDAAKAADVRMDVQLAINTPVTTVPTSVRTAHIDRPNKLFAGLYYLRPDQDVDSRGGDLEICRLPAGARPRFAGFEIDSRGTKVDRVVLYRQNVLVLFLNTARSIHGVTPRFRSLHTRRFVNLVAELPEPLFDIREWQGSRLRKLTYPYRRQWFAWRRTRDRNAMDR